MTLQTHSRARFLAWSGFTDDEGRLSERAIADSLRAPLSRWGLSPKGAVLKHVRAELRAAGVDDTSGVPRVLQKLVDLGECAELYVGHEPYLAPIAPRWIPVGDGVSAYLGVSEPPPEISLIHSDHGDIVRRFWLDADEDAAALELVGVKVMSLAEWLVPPGYLRHASRRMRRPARNDAVSLGGFWDLLEHELVENGLTLSADAEVRILAGNPGEFFGRHDSSNPEGRWTTDQVDGLWCAYRRGYGDVHWHPCIVAVSGNERRALDLYDADEWRWAVLARGRKLGAEEIVRTEGLKIQLTFPAPGQLRAAMNLLGSPSGAWAWTVSPGSPDLWSLLV